MSSTDSVNGSDGGKTFVPMDVVWAKHFGYTEWPAVVS
jgi:hypothetical protein